MNDIENLTNRIERLETDTTIKPHHHCSLCNDVIPGVIPSCWTDGITEKLYKLCLCERCIKEEAIERRSK